MCQAHVVFNVLSLYLSLFPSLYLSLFPSLSFPFSLSLTFFILIVFVIVFLASRHCPVRIILARAHPRTLIACVLNLLICQCCLPLALPTLPIAPSPTSPFPFSYVLCALQAICCFYCGLCVASCQMLCLTISRGILLHPYHSYYASTCPSPSLSLSPSLC